MEAQPSRGAVDRRHVLAGAVVGSAAFLASARSAANAGTGGGAAFGAGAAPAIKGGVELPALPYAIDALAPVISQRTLEFHHGKHHKAYVDTTLELVKGTPLEGQELEAIVRAAAADKEKTKLFNNAAQIWNHTFYWNSLKPGGGGKPGAPLLAKIESAFKTFDEFKAQLVEAAVSQFGTGWAWLVEEGGALKVVKTADADLPLVHGQRALLTIDVWEHAYYLDYQNLRKKYAQEVVDKLLNWDWAAQQLG
ncbi:MAG: superoxide dismutase [Planctomycetota bacterium]|nr:MAG: superoxide dismutase [Planctomycetota bacterium]